MSTLMQLHGWSCVEGVCVCCGEHCPKALPACGHWSNPAFLPPPTTKLISSENWSFPCQQIFFLANQNKHAMDKERRVQTLRVNTKVTIAFSYWGVLTVTVWLCSGCGSAARVIHSALWKLCCPIGVLLCLGRVQSRQHRVRQQAWGCTPERQKEVGACVCAKA